MIRFYAIALSLFLGGSVQASQIHTLNEEREIEVEVSNTELNRIIVEKDRISDVFAHGNSLEILPDERIGQIFIRVASSSKDGIRLTLTTEDGRVQDMRLLSQAIQGQTIILRENAEFKTDDKTWNEQEAVVEILGIFLKGDVPRGFRLTESYEGQHLYTSDHCSVEVFPHHNSSEQIIQLDEEMFVSGSQTRAVHVVCPSLEPNKSTLIWRVTSHD